MKSFVLAAAAALLPGIAAASELPIVNLSCTGNLSVHYDGAGRAYINGNGATFKKEYEGSWRIKGSGYTFYLDRTTEGTLSASYTGPKKTSGSCKVSTTEAGPATKKKESGGSREDDAIRRASEGRFDARGPLPCAPRDGQPLRSECSFGVARAGDGTATVVITRPDGTTRTIYFRNGKATGSDASQADGEMKAYRGGDATTVLFGEERYEIPDAVIYGG